MDIYFAPLEGVTDVIFRRVHHECFSGISKYYIPFLCPTQHKVFTPKERRSISLESNAGIPVVPQILTKDPSNFLWAAEKLAEEGHTEVNLNVGCPSGTVTAKGKGSGMLREKDALRSFLDEIYANAPIPVSIKTRIGFESVDEWPSILEIYADYPVHELIVHARTRSQFYKGTPHAELCADVCEKTSLPLVYNGDVFTPSDFTRIHEMLPGTSALMIGRGLIANPALARELHGGAALTLEELKHFHDRLYEEYCRDWPKNAILGRMHEIMYYMSCCFEDCTKPRKAIRKANSLPAYEDAIAKLFGEHELRNEPGFQPYI